MTRIRRICADFFRINMAKKLFLTLSIIAFLASCGTRRNVVQDPATFDEGVVINGVRWATRNVDMPGTFAENPESPGMFFQWNRKKGWNAVDEEVEGWDWQGTTSTEWKKENNPCPDGWRVPTQEELQSLVDAGSEWAAKNGISGRIFGIAPYRIFLPAVGLRNGVFDGVLEGAVGFYLNHNQTHRSDVVYPVDYRSAVGIYWSGTSFGDNNVFILSFSNNDVFTGWHWWAHGHSIRCVAK